MRTADYYTGREQTYIKHFFLERYLERVAYKIGSFANSFVYVDGFSGPWRSADEAFEDTSFMIAIGKLREVVEGLSKIGRQPTIRCVFVEKDPEAYTALCRAVHDVHDFRISTFNGDFEELIPNVLEEVGSDFSLTFIDPTGWTGFGLQRIERLLQHRPGEVIVNVMFDHINRFLEHPDEQYVDQFNALFGGPGWETAVHAGDRREEQIIDLYRRRFRSTGEFDYVRSTRVLKPTSNRSYFHLVYGTRHLEGLRVFSCVEKAAAPEQEQVREVAKRKCREDRTRQTEMTFTTADLSEQSPSGTERCVRLGEARDLLQTLLGENERVSYDQACGVILELPMVWESDIKDIIVELRDAGVLIIEGMEPRQRRPQTGHFLARTPSLQPPA